MAVYSNLLGTTSKEFTFGKKGLTLFPTDTNPVPGSNVKPGDFWIDLAEQSLRFRTAENDDWVLPALDDIRVSGNKLISGATFHTRQNSDFVTNPNVTQDIVLYASGLGAIQIDADFDSPRIEVPAEKHLEIKAGNTISGTSGNLLLNSGTATGAGTDGNIIINDIVWPTADGTNTQVLSTDGAGNLVWRTVLDLPVQSYTITSTPNEVLSVGNKYLIVGSIDVDLPDYTTLTAGDAITFSKNTNDTPVIDASAGQNINSKSGVVSTITYNNTDEMVFIYDGTLWQLQYTPTDYPTELDDLTDVDTTTATPSQGQVLQYNGTSWVNAELEYTSIAGSPTTTNITYSVPANAETLLANSFNFISTEISVTLPTYTGMPIGTNVRIAKANSITPTVLAYAGQEIETAIGIGTEMLYDVSTEILFVYNGTRWQLQYPNTDTGSSSSLYNLDAYAFAEFDIQNTNGTCNVIRSGNVTSAERVSAGIYKVTITNDVVGGFNLINDGIPNVTLDFNVLSSDTEGWEVAGIVEKSDTGTFFITFKIIHTLANGTRVVEEPTVSSYTNKILVRII